MMPQGRHGSSRASVLVAAAALLALASCASRDTAPSPFERRPVVRVANEFAVDIYRRLAERDTSLFFSPYSLTSALMMVAEGARGRTAAEMGEVMHFPATSRAEGDSARPFDLRSLHEGYAAVNADLRDAAEQGVELRVANALWVDKRYPLGEPFLQTLQQYYGAGATREVDFEHDPKGAARRINAWGKEQTNGRIRDLVGDATDGPALLANAVFFRGDWTTPFPAHATVESDFRLSGGGVARVPLMAVLAREGARYGAFRDDGSLFPTPLEIPADSVQAAEVPRYPDERGFAAIELPYEGERLSMVVLAPNRPDGLADLERTLSFEDLSGWITRLAWRPVDVRLPRFRLETSYAMDGVVRRLGMTTVFGSGADLSGISESLYLGGIRQKAFVDVTEKGTEAAAATEVLMVGSAGTVRETEPFIPLFRADRPFLFLIRDRRSGLILFLGRYSSPE